MLTGKSFCNEKHQTHQPDLDNRVAILDEPGTCKAPRHSLMTDDFPSTSSWRVWFIL